MRNIPESQIVARLQEENPWWCAPHVIPKRVREYTKREYANLFLPLVRSEPVRRAVIMMGPRRVGKTVLIHHAIEHLIAHGVNPTHICYVSVDHPLYNGLRLEEILELFAKTVKANKKKTRLYVFWDEIQYLREWETHLKILVDEHPNIKFVASGSAAAALRLKSMESGAGRFTDFLLPPLTFHEYLTLLNQGALVRQEDAELPFIAPNIDALNTQFVRYLNFGGYPEVILSPEIQADPARFVKNDIIDKVLLRDLPSLYGISDVQELNYLFTTLAYNTADEISLEELSKNSGVAKNTIRRYIEYLEAAFLIRVVHRIDRNAKRFRRANYFKVYLTNPSIRSALFSPIDLNDECMGRLAETAVFSQWFHSSTTTLFYARWNKGEVDMVALNQVKPWWAVEVKWSDRCVTHHGEIQNPIDFCIQNKLESMRVTTRSVSVSAKIRGIMVRFVPTSLYCYTVGYNLVTGRLKHPSKNPVAS